MGFFIMLGSALAGIALLATGAMQSGKDKRWLASVPIGIILMAFAVWLGWPK